MQAVWEACQGRQKNPAMHAVGCSKNAGVGVVQQWELCRQMEIMAGTQCMVKGGLGEGAKQRWG